MSSYKLNIDVIRQQAYGRWLEIIQYVAPGVFDAAIANNGKHVDCPLHGGKEDFRFINRSRNGRGSTAEVGAAMCTCGPFSDGFALLQRATGKSFYEVLKDVNECLNGAQVQKPQYKPRPEVVVEDLEARNRDILHRVSKLWAAGREVNLADIPYYRNRGICADVLRDVKDIRSMASLGYYTMENRQFFKLGSFPAMLGLMRSARGDAVAVHRTWLSQDRCDKAPVASAKKLSESPGVAGAAIRLFDATDSTVLGLTEGIETALAVRELASKNYWPELSKIPVWACFAERNLRSFQIPDDLNLTKIIIFADNDERNTGMAAAMAFKERMRNERPSLVVDIKMPEVTGWDWLDALVNL